MSVYPSLPTLFPPEAMLSTVLEIGAQDGDSFGAMTVTLLLGQGHRVRGELLEVATGGTVDVVVLETNDGPAFVPVSAIVAAQLHPDDAQEHRLRTGEAMVEDTYADHRHRCWSMGSDLAEDEVDFSVAEVDLSIRLDDTGLPHDGLAALMLDGFLDVVEQTLSRIIRVPGSRHALIYGCPRVSIQAQDTDQCSVSGGTLHIPVQVDDDRLVFIDDDALEAQIGALLVAHLDEVPETWRSEGWYLVTSDADEQATWLEESIERTAPFSLDESNLFAIDSDKAIELRDMVRGVYTYFRQTHPDAVGAQVRGIVMRRQPTCSCALEDGVLVLPVVVKDHWELESLSYYEVDEELDRLLGRE